jgi:hypothetical protein
MASNEGGQKRVLITTAYSDDPYRYDYWAANYPNRRFRYTLMRKTARALDTRQLDVYYNPESDAWEPESGGLKARGRV